MGERVKPGSKGITLRPVLGVLVQEMRHESGVVGDVPMNTISANIWNGLVNGLCVVLEAARPILKHAKDEHVSRRPDLQLVRIPGRCPLLCILVNGSKE